MNTGTFLRCINLISQRWINLFHLHASMCKRRSTLGKKLSSQHEQLQPSMPLEARTLPSREKKATAASQTSNPACCACR